MKWCWVMYEHDQAYANGYNFLGAKNGVKMKDNIPSQTPNGHIKKLGKHNGLPWLVFLVD